ncbi:MAG: DUF885 domain-containing protein [Gemmatimonadaceae bacterium]|nr:DUF885 domain-containing protein [Gemmatimonadaceae bacterium]
MSAPFSAVMGGYLDLRWRLNPVEATFHGLSEFDGLFAAYDADSVREQLAALVAYENAIEEAEADTLDEEIDRTAVLHSLRHDMLLLGKERQFVHDPSYHLMHAVNGIFLLLARVPADPSARAAALLARLDALPAFLEAAVSVLTEPDSIFVGVAASMIPGAIALIQDGLDAPSLDLSMLDPLELERARVLAVESLDAFGEALSEMTGRAGDHFAIGRELFDRKLHTAHMIAENADELLRFGEDLRASAIAELEEIAAEIDPGASWQEIAERLRSDVPSPESVLDEYREAMDAARHFTITQQLMPATDAVLEVMPTPDFLRPLIPLAAYQGPGAFDPVQRGLFLVTLPDEGQSWRPQCRAELPSTALHEGIPGHHLQMSIGNTLSSVPRRVLSTPASREGWALYCESLMAEMGFLDSAEERFFQAHNLLWRAVRVILDVSLHTKGMRMEEASERLQSELGLDASIADAEAKRYCAYPTYQLCYAVGRRDILALRQDLRKARAEEFTLGTFHEELLQYGALPTALARWGMGLAAS